MTMLKKIILWILSIIAAALAGIFLSRKSNAPSNTAERIDVLKKDAGERKKKLEEQLADIEKKKEENIEEVKHSSISDLIARFNRNRRKLGDY